MPPARWMNEKTGGTREREAGRRLRRLCLLAVDECAEELGLLAAANLRELLETGLSPE